MVSNEAALLNYKTILAIRGAKNLSASEKSVMYSLASRGDESWPSQSTIAKDAGLSLSAAKTALRELKAMGMICSCPRKESGTLIYQLAADEELARIGLLPRQNLATPLAGKRLQKNKDERERKEKDLEVASNRRPESQRETHAAVIERFSYCFERARGMIPILDARTHKAAWEIAKMLPKDEAVDLVDAAFEDDFFRNKLGQLYQIVNNINAYRRPIRPQPKVYIPPPPPPPELTQGPDPEAAQKLLDELYERRND